MNGIAPWAMWPHSQTFLALHSQTISLPVKCTMRTGRTLY